MLLIRLAQRQDLKAIVELAQSSGGGLTNLPADEATIAGEQWQIICKGRL